MTLTGNVSLTSLGNDVTFGSTVGSDASSPAALSITAGAGDVTFVKAVGAGAGRALGAVTLVSAADVTFLETLTAASFTQSTGTSTGETSFGGIADLSGAFAFTGNKLTLNAGLTTDGNVTITNAGQFNAQGVINTDGAFSQTGTGANSLSSNVIAVSYTHLTPPTNSMG